MKDERAFEVTGPKYQNSPVQMVDFLKHRACYLSLYVCVRVCESVLRGGSI